MSAERAACNPFESLEIGYRRCARASYLHTRNADAYVRRLDHADIVGAVSDGQKNCFLVLLDELDHQRLLERRNAA